MELSTIEMDPEAARTAYEEYAAAVKASRDEEDVAIAQGYKALADGKALIRLSRTLAAGGVTEIDGRAAWRREALTITVPRLAVIRADAKIAYTAGVDRTGGCLITAGKRSNELHPNNRRDRFQIPDGTFEAVNEKWAYVRAVVPNIPPRLRPKRGLSLYTILWEAEWAIDPLPPHDPALLRQLGGDLYIVLGCWDLTELERSVLTARV